MSTAPAPPTPKLRRRWLQFSLRTLLVLMVFAIVIPPLLLISDGAILRWSKAIRLPGVSHA